MIFERKKYLDELIAGRGNGLVKIITGVRRCGKSFLLFDIWHNWLLEHGVTDNHIIEIQLDDFRNRRLRKPDALLDYIDSKVVDDGNPYYIVLDEVQLVEEFVDVILSLTHMRNVDVYVSGSNSRFLSSDVVTEFRGRGDEIRIWPLTFDEYFSGIGGDIRKAWLNYYSVCQEKNGYNENNQCCGYYYTELSLLFIEHRKAQGSKSSRKHYGRY